MYFFGSRIYRSRIERIKNKMWWTVVVGILLIWGILIGYSWFEEVVLKEEGLIEEEEEE